MRYAMRSVCLGALAAMMLLAAPLEAQRGPAGRRGGGQDRELAERRVRAQMARMMQERLALSDEQSEQLSQVVRGFREQQRALYRLEEATRRRVDALLLEGGTDEEEALELLARMADLRAQEAELRAAEEEALLEVISPVQLLVMQSMREQIGRRIRALGPGRGDPSSGMRRRGGGHGR